MTVLFPILVACFIAQDVTFSKGIRGSSGVVTYNVTSPYQKGTTRIHVLVGPHPKNKPLPVIYVLPVEAGNQSRYGNGLQEILKAGLHNKYPAVFVAPTFSHLPWYADHPTHPQIRQETYFLSVVLPFIDRTYPVQKKGARYLLGFSKSGWGAWTMLLRHPKFFSRAAAWDAPLAKAKPDQFGMGPIFGNQANFAKYEISGLLKHADRKQIADRLAMVGWSNFAKHHQSMHQKMESWKIPHLYGTTHEKKHVWSKVWMEAGIRFLLQIPEKKRP